MSFTTHTDNKKEDILILGIGPTQRLEHTLTAEKMYSINFTNTNENFCLSYIIMEQIVTDLLMVQKFTNLKQKILKL